MKIAFIHNERRLKTGAHIINSAISRNLKNQRVEIKHFYPKGRLIEIPPKLKGLHNILFFHSLLEHKDEILKYDFIQGTTYTPLAFLSFPIPVISHFGSTTGGFIRSVPQTRFLEKELREIWQELKKEKIIKGLNIKTRRPLRDIAEIEVYVGKRANAVIAVSKNVANELAAEGMDPKKIFIVRNAIEDFWFERRLKKINPPAIIHIGRIGGDVFTMKLKGLDRLLSIYGKFPETPKITIATTPNRRFVAWFRRSFPNDIFYPNLNRLEIPDKLREYRGSILIIPSRYEGFSLSLIEGMSQGLIPVSFPVGVAPEVIKNGENGFIVNSLEEMEKRIREIFKDEVFREKLSKNSSRTSRIFRAEKLARRLISVYKKILASS